MFKDLNMIKTAALPLAPEIRDACNGCSICKKECAFLSEYGNPGTIAKLSQTDPDRWQAIAFECSLCGLCNAVCPKGLDPSGMFLDFRRQAVAKGQANLSVYQGLLNYEKKGTSKRYTFYSLPKNCDTVFFPGCTLPGTRPDSTWKTFEYLQKQISTIGLVLDCCTKPSHDLGRQTYFNDMFFEMCAYLTENKINTIIVACPNCHKIFNTYGKAFKVETVYDLMSRCGLDDEERVTGSITLHDPCPVRFENNIQDSVRSVVRARGLDIIDTHHERTKTFCCGEGGSVACVSPGFARKWAQKRVNETHPHKIVTYCAGCVSLLSKKADTFHILDLMFNPIQTMKGKARVSKAPFTYLNRLTFKRKLKKLPTKAARERTFTPVNSCKKRSR